MCDCVYVVFFNDTATTEIYTLSLHDALPISICSGWFATMPTGCPSTCPKPISTLRAYSGCTSSRTPSSRTCSTTVRMRSEEHTSELQSRQYLVCRLLLEKKEHCWNAVAAARP